MYKISVVPNNLNEPNREKNTINWIDFSGAKRRQLHTLPLPHPTMPLKLAIGVKKIGSTLVMVSFTILQLWRILNS
jgi:hypothetical protein